MTFEKDPFKFKGIPDFALQPAKEADDEYNNKYTPRGATNRFDPAAYERVLHESAKRAAEVEGKEGSESLDKQQDKAFDSADVSNEVSRGFTESKEPEPIELADTEEAAEPLELAETEEAAPIDLAEIEEEAPVDLAKAAEEEAPVDLAEVEEEAPVDLAEVEETAPIDLAEVEEAAPVDLAEVEEEEAPIDLAKVEEEAAPSDLTEIKEEAAAAALEIDEETAPVELAESKEEKDLEELAELEGEVVVVELEGEDVPVSVVPPTKKRPVFKPAFVPKSTPPKVVPVIGSMMSSKLNLVDMKTKAPIRFTIEEDILVPDIKPDMAQILAMEGQIRLDNKDIHTGKSEKDTVRISGDLSLQTLYIPEDLSDGEPVVAIETKVSFKNESEIKASPNSDLAITAKIESIDFTIVNERKFRARATALIGIKEYNNIDVEVFEGVRDEEVQMLKEDIKFTDVAFRKTDSIEIKEEIALKENMPEVIKILSHNVNIVENHKQMTKEKAVINASVYFNIMYLGAEENPDVAKADMDVDYEEVLEVPVFYQGKTEFTQFIRMDGEDLNDQNPAGSKVSFDIAALNFTATEDANGQSSIIEMDLNIDTELETYKTFEKQVVTDVYHHIKDIQYETDEIGVKVQSGSGVAELSAREIINIPEKYGSIDEVVYLSANINERKSYIDQTKNIVEGIIDVNLICTPADAKKTVFNIRQEIPFRSVMEIPGITSEMTASNDIVLKELWFDKINNKQVEVNAGILINAAISSQKKYQLVRNISFSESPQDNTNLPGIVLYVSRAGDTIWKIAKKYRTTIDEVLKINDLEHMRDIKPGTKLLIVAKYN